MLREHIGGFMMNWRKPVIYGLLYLSGSKIPKYFKEIKKMEKFSLKEKEEYQEEKLKKLLLHAWKNIPYYHKVLGKVKVVVEGKVNLNNFNKIPLLTKEIIRKEKENLYSKDYEKRGHYENTSGGSTGEPVRFIQDKKYNEWNIANKIFFFNEWFGKKIGQSEINLWGSERDIQRNSLSLKEKIINFLYNRTFLNAFKVDDKKLKNFVKIINKKKPVSMWVYVESIDYLAKFIEKNKIKIHSPDFIISTAGTLYPQIRKNIEDVFRCPVYNQYGSREVGAIAIECKEQKGLHEFFWTNYIEIINSKIYVTNLNNFSMPLIRYEIGDIASEARSNKCKCGKNNLKFKEIKGRTINHFKTKKGDIVHCQYLIHQFYFNDWIKKFQIIQKQLDLIICKVVLNGSKDTEQMKKIEDNIKIVMGKDCKIKWEFVNEIEPTKSGKFLYTICELE